MIIFFEIVVLMTVAGLCFGGLLALANKKLTTEVEPLPQEGLPKGQTKDAKVPVGMSYIEALVLKVNKVPSLGMLGQEPVPEMQVASGVPQVARVMCRGTLQVVGVRYDYYGEPDCVEENVLFGGNKVCKYGCLGLGSCVRACPFAAIELSAEGLPVVDTFKCTACGQCQAVCPKKIITLIPSTAKTFNNCAAHYPEQDVKKICTVACIGCGICMQQCPYGAITMDNNLPVIEHSKCVECKEIACAAHCPTKSMRRLS